jgi:predicted nuclease of predicted toxin-antitoxin system
MKILLDENLPKKLKSDFGENHEVFTVRNMYWNGKKNGELLGLMLVHNFEGFVTLDKNLRFQQYIPKFPIKFFVLDAPNSKLETLQLYIEKLVSILETDSDDQLFMVQIP